MRRRREADGFGVASFREGDVTVGEVEGKMKYRTGLVGLPVLRAGSMVLAAAGILGIAAVAGAQPAPPPVPPPPPSTTAPVDPNAPPPPATGAPQTPPTATGAPQTPPPVDPNAPTTPPVDPNAPPAVQPPPAPPPPVPPPVAQTPAPPPQPTLQWSPTVRGPGADTVTPGEGADAKGPTKPLPWRGSTFTWNQAGTTTVFGVGRDNIGGEGEFYGWDFTFAPNYYFLDQDKDKVRAFAEIGWTTEFTNSDLTADKRETLFKDMQLGLSYNRTILESGGSDKGEYVTSGTLTGRFILPTSSASYEQGRYLTTALALGAKQKVKILGSKATGLQNATVGVTGTWGHLFARSYQPTNEKIDRPVRNASGSSFESDVFSSTSLVQNQLTAGFTLDLNLIENLSLGSYFRIVGRFKHDFSDKEDCVEVATGECVVPQGLGDEASLYQPFTTFDVSLTYALMEVLDVTLGYNNDTRWIGEDSQRRNVFYSPDAQFYLDLVANLDAIYTNIAGAVSPKKTETAKTAKTAKASAAHSR
jgi:hypothetical protein